MRYVHLSMYEREVIEVEVRVGTRWRSIGRRLGRSAATISREVRRAGGPEGYEAGAAQALAEQRRQGWRRTRRFDDPRVVEQLRCGLQQQHSPEQIVGCWPRGLPPICIQTVYNYLRRERPAWCVHLRQDAARRRPSYRQPHKFERIRNTRSISQRPVVVEKRRRTGDWESDTVRGADRQAGIATHVDRRTGFVVLAWLADRSATTYNQATLAAFARSGVTAHTFTVDNGMEFAKFTGLELALGALVYFAHPHCAWERGTNENTNGLLRQYFPKDRDFRTLSQAELMHAQNCLNQRPRKRLQYRRPADLMPVALQD